ncbi:MAG: CHAP domain-containing protein [Candidatus Saccharimonadales bacterium]
MVSVKLKTKIQKTKMAKKRKQSNHISLFSKHGFAALTFLVVAVFSLSSFSLVKADEFEAKIKKLEQQNEQKDEVHDQLGSEASSIKGAINKLQDEINAKQAIIDEYQNEVGRLEKEIAAAQKELDKQRAVLGETIKTIYVEGDITTLEMLATSKNLSDFFDKQQYRESVRNKVKETLDKITQLKLDLNTKKQKTEKLLKEQKVLQDELLKQRSKQNNLLSLKESEKAAVEGDIAKNNERITELRRLQAIENAKHQASGSIVTKGKCGGGYPADAINGLGLHWGCNYAMDNTIDNWGMYNRECVSYTAWKVYASGRHMPYWGGHGNAHLWDDNARAAGIPVSSTPKKGDVAVAHWGALGHVMYVESVNSNGTINISQYNASFNGTYSEVYNMSAAGLVFIHF